MPTFLIARKAEGEAAAVAMSSVLPLFRQESCQNKELSALVEKDSNFKLLPVQKKIATDDRHLH